MVSVEEVWKDIDGYEGAYQVSNLGNVRSLRSNSPKCIYQTCNTYGYLQVRLHKDNIHKHYYVHRLVAMAFVDGYKDGFEVNHKDFDKSNNVYTNLEWVTKSQNQKHMAQHYHKDKVIHTCPVCGKEISGKATYCKEHYPDRKDYLIPNKEVNLLEDLKTLNFKQIGKKYNMSDNGVRKICRRLGLPSTKEDVIEYRKKCGTYVPPKDQHKKSKEEAYVHYEVGGISKTAHGWSLFLGLESKVIGRYAQKHSYEEVLKYIKDLYEAKSVNIAA